MKISIWQQFSSNHSAAFSIVAKFESAEKAKAVAAEITKTLLETYRWKYYELEEWQISPTEILQKFENGVAFGRTWMLSEEHILQALQVHENEIYVSDSPGYSNFDGSDLAFMKLFTKFGAEVIAVREEAGGGVFLTLSADAFDEEAAQSIKDKLIERHSYTGIKDYVHDIKTDSDIHYGAESIQQVGKRIFFENIYLFPQLEALSYWYDFIRAFSLKNVVLSLKHEQKSLETELDEPKFKKLMWPTLKFETWRSPAYDIEIVATGSDEADVLKGVIEKAIVDKDYLWIAFYRDYKNAAQWQDDMGYLRLQNEAARAYVDSLETFIGSFNELKIEYRLTEFLQKVYTIPDLFDEETLRLKAIVRDCEFQYKAIHRQDSRISIEAGAFPKAESNLGLEAFVAWLQSKGATVTINLHQRNKTL